MKLISLYKPIVLRSSLKDMNPTQQRTACELLSNQLALIPDKDGIRFEKLSNNNERSKYFLYGSEAVCFYRQLLGLPDVSITDIDVDDIVASADDLDIVTDLLFLISRVKTRNDRIKKLRNMDAPVIIMWNEDRMLQEYLESLQDNNWCGNPFVYDMPTGDENDEKVASVEYKSLVDIDYSLLHHQEELHPGKQ